MFSMQIWCSEGWTPTDKFRGYGASDMAYILQFGVGIPHMVGCGQTFRIPAETMVRLMGETEERGSFSKGLKQEYCANTIPPVMVFLTGMKELYDLADKSDGRFVFKIVDDFAGVW